ncbi:MAG: OadG family protein [Helicobacteraceae bacterium]|jgi:sodium pump decarboxylase gamma subunit|nr:OadG family protein [Helicobacteraceae bacterium]
MESGNLVLEAAKIMVVGMTTVFCFLCFMIYFLKAQGWFLMRFFPQAKETAAEQGAKISSETLRKIALEAIREYTKTRG